MKKKTKDVFSSENKFLFCYQTYIKKKTLLMCYLDRCVFNILYETFMESRV